MPDTQSTIDTEDISRFNSQAGQWWDPDGPMKPLHLFTPVRLEYILAAARRTGLTADQPNRLLPLDGRKVEGGLEQHRILNVRRDVANLRVALRERRAA